MYHWIFCDPEVYLCLREFAGHCLGWISISTQIAKFMGPTWGPPGSCRPQMGPILAPWILLTRKSFIVLPGSEPGHCIKEYWHIANPTSDNKTRVYHEKKSISMNGHIWRGFNSLIYLSIVAYLFYVKKQMSPFVIHCKGRVIVKSLMRIQCGYQKKISGVPRKIWEA